MFEERKERVDMQAERHNDANKAVENVCDAIKVMAPLALSQKKQVREPTAVLQRCQHQILTIR